MGNGGADVIISIVELQSTVWKLWAGDNGLIIICAVGNPICIPIFVA